MGKGGWQSTLLQWSFRETGLAKYDFHNSGLDILTNKVRSADVPKIELDIYVGKKHKFEVWLQATCQTGHIIYNVFLSYTVL